MPLHRLATIAILGADTVVGSALYALLGGHGYRIAPIDSHPTGVVDELLDGADLLLLAPRLDEGAREAFLGGMGKRVPQNAEMPVIALRTALEDPPEKEGVLRVPWPCETRALVEPTESALLEAPVPSAAPDTPSQEEGVKEPPEHDEPIRSPRKPMHLVGGKGSPEELHLPPGYVLDRSDPDVWVLHCPQGAPVARFSAQGATAEAIEREARAHHKERNRSA